MHPPHTKPSFPQYTHLSASICPFRGVKCSAELGLQHFHQPERELPGSAVPGQPGGELAKGGCEQESPLSPDLLVFHGPSPFCSEVLVGVSGWCKSRGKNAGVTDPGHDSAVGDNKLQYLYAQYQF